jgi:hypothetical protein
MNSKIRTLVFLGVTALAVSAAGCIIDESSSADDSCAPNRYVTVSWQIHSTTSNSILSCEQASAKSVNLNLGAYTYQYQCSLYGASTTGGIPEGNYDTSMQLVGTDGSDLSDTATNGVVTTTIPFCAPVTLPLVTFDIP